MSNDNEMAALNHSGSPSKRSKHDWTLPSSFLATLCRPVEDVISELLPSTVPSVVTATTATNPTPAPAPVQNAFVGAFKKIADILTEKGGHAHATTQSALVDLFFDMAPPAQPKHLQNLLEKAWKEDASATCRLIFQTRSIHEGKGFKEGFWVAAGWLWEKHPRTFLANLHMLVDPTCKRDRSKARDAKRAEAVSKANKGVETLDEEGDTEGNLEKLPEYPARPHGTFDDLIDLLVLHLNGQLNASIDRVPDAVDEGLAPAHMKTSFKNDRIRQKSGAKRDRSAFRVMGIAAWTKAAEAAKATQSEHFKAKLAKCGTKEAKYSLYGTRLEDALKKDDRFKALCCAVVDIFVKQLKADLALLDKHRDFLKQPEEARKPFIGDSSPHLFGMTYAAKWVPTPGKSADRQLRFASALALMMFPGEGVDIGREKLQREVLSPLRSVLKVPEVKMGKGAWKIDYTKVPSRAMSRYAQCFLEHDPEGFEAYLVKVAQGKVTIAGASMFPHEILIDAMSGKNLLLNRMADLQWRSLVDSLKSSASAELENCLAIADVSGSMGHFASGDKKNPQPINVCLALTLLLGELAAPPWNGLFFTFSSVPQACYIDPSYSLASRIDSLARADWEMSTNFYKVFDLILATAIKEKLRSEDMVKKLFIFSDMQFDQCVERQEGDTEYTAIKRKFVTAGYTLPELVFWNLAPRAAGAPKPVRADQAGVSLLSGFSGAMMKYFLGQQAQQDDEEMAAAMASDWEAVRPEDEEEDFELVDEEGDVSGTATATAPTGPRKRVKKEKKDDPLTVVKKVLGAESFKGVIVVD